MKVGEGLIRVEINWRMNSTEKKRETQSFPLRLLNDYLSFVSGFPIILIHLMNSIACYAKRKENSLHKFIRSEMTFLKKYYLWWPLGNSSHLSHLA